MVVLSVKSRTKKDLVKIEPGGEASDVLMNINTLFLELGSSRWYILSRSETTPPVSPANQDAYIVATGATGVWASQVGNLAVYSEDSAGWVYSKVIQDMLFFVDDEDGYVIRGASVLEIDIPPAIGIQKSSVVKGITASVTQTQGQQALTKQNNVVDTVANANDVVTLPTAAAGLEVTIWNRGAQTLQMFPASGDKLNNASVNASETLAAGSRITYYAIDAEEWLTK